VSAWSGHLIVGAPVTVETMDSKTLRRKAERTLRLAAEVSDPKAAVALRKLAAEFLEKAEEQEHTQPKE
jgi:hypothetical protein